MNVIGAKLITGEEVIATVEESTSLLNPVRILKYSRLRKIDSLVHPQTGQVMVNIAPFMVMAPDQEFNGDHWSAMALIEVQPPQELVAAYLQAVSGLQIAR